MQHFRPEFLNRIDEIVIFNALGKPEIEKIIDLQLQNLRRMLAERKIEITLTEKAHELLFQRGLRSAVRGAAAASGPSSG